MVTYLILNLLVCVGLGLLVYLRAPQLVTRRRLLALAVLLVLTAIFDNLIIANDIVAYNTDKILGLYIGRAPIEDFMYCVGAFLAVSYAWENIGD